MEGRELGKKLFALLLVAGLALVVLSSEAKAQNLTLESGAVFSPLRGVEESLLDDLFIQDRRLVEESRTSRVVGQSPPPDREYVERTQRRQVVGQSNPRYDPEMPAQWALRLGGLFVTNAVDEMPSPNSTLSLGICARVLLPPDGLHMLELSFDTSLDRLELDVTPGVMEDFYQEYFDVVVSFLGSFGARYGVESPLYWGVGLGYSKETARANYTDDARNGLVPIEPWPHSGVGEAFNESLVVQGKIGWDSGRNMFAELVYKKLIDSDRNLDEIFHLVVGIYF